ncbi:MAG: hypothetical protein CM1200mP3_03140 [Chloroflexota bacterium]|nr:MAG: hypothetical protein CM1200mP3_03140 [Chloroflexota bacterium]
MPLLHLSFSRNTKLERSFGAQKRRKNCRYNTEKQTTQSETRRIEASGEIEKNYLATKAVNGHDDGDKKPFVESIHENGDQEISQPNKNLSYGVNRGRIDQAIKSIHASSHSKTIGKMQT